MGLILSFYLGEEEGLHDILLQITNTDNTTSSDTAITAITYGVPSFVVNVPPTSTGGFVNMPININLGITETSGNSDTYRYRIINNGGAGFEATTRAGDTITPNIFSEAIDAEGLPFVLTPNEVGDYTFYGGSGK